MDSTILLFFVLPLVLGVITFAFRFMRFVGFLTGSKRRVPSSATSADALLSFDERLAEKLRELEQQRR